MWLIIVDAHSKWPEIINFNSNAKAYRLIKEFKKLFSRFGLPLHCVTDGGPQFRNDDFHKFLEGNGVKHTYSPPYHPVSKFRVRSLSAPAGAAVTRRPRIVNDVFMN